MAFGYGYQPRTETLQTIGLEGSTNDLAQVSLLVLGPVDGIGVADHTDGGTGRGRPTVETIPITVDQTAGRIGVDDPFCGQTLCI